MRERPVAPVATSNGLMRQRPVALVATSESLMRERIIGNDLLDMDQRLARVLARQGDHATDQHDRYDNPDQTSHGTQLVSFDIRWQKTVASLFARLTPPMYSPLRMTAPTILHASSRHSTKLPIVLIGMMGVGKSTVGRRLANRLNIPFVDADSEIETAAGLSVAEIFERFGEEQFRDGERRVIARLIDGTRKVIATGGGAFMQADTRALILDNATTVWLQADIETLVQRVGRRGDRPLLVDRDPETVLRELAEIRNPVYALAPVHVFSHPAPHEATVDAILKELRA
jgi:shikimate kinase